MGTNCNETTRITCEHRLTRIETKLDGICEFIHESRATNGHQDVSIAELRKDTKAYSRNWAALWGVVVGLVLWGVKKLWP